MPLPSLPPLLRPSGPALQLRAAAVAGRLIEDEASEASATTEAAA